MRVQEVESSSRVTRMDYLEGLFKKYSDVPREVIVKEDMLREGFHFTEAALNFDPKRKTYQLFSWDQSTIEEIGTMDSKAPVKLPDIIDIDGGIYGLRRMRMRPRICVGSPYLIDVTEGKLAVLDRQTRTAIAGLRPFPPDPKYFSKVFPDGTPYYEVSPPDLNLIVFRQCQYWGPKEECKFCDINRNASSKKQLGQVRTTAPKKPDQVAEVVEEILLREPWSPDRRPLYIHINGGTVTGKLAGLTEQEFYGSFVEAIKARVGNRWPIGLQTVPWSVEQGKRGFQQGVNQRKSNFEVWDKRLFEIISPGKAAMIGYDEWIKRVLDQVNIFGEGNVQPGFVAGVEMAQPWGFKTVEEAVQSTTEGLEFLMSHGVTPRPISWCVEGLSDLSGQTPPPTDYFIQVDRNWFEIWRKFRLPELSGFRIGPGRNEYMNSAAFDMGEV